MTTEMSKALRKYNSHATPGAQIVAYLYASLDHVTPQSVLHIAAHAKSLPGSQLNSVQARIAFSQCDRFGNLVCGS